MSAHGAYGGYDIKQLFHMVDAAKNDLPQTYAQIQAWKRAEEILAVHGRTLLDCRNALTTHWPPDQNEAAAVYLGHLDDLLGTVDQTAHAVATNRGLLEQMATDITNTHRTLEPLYREYLSNEQKLAAYQAELNAAQAVGATVGDAAGRGAGVAAGGGSSLLAGVFGKVGSAMLGSAAKAGMQLVTAPPVATSRQDQINQQARDAIVKLGVIADDTSSHLQPPPPYQPPRVTGIDQGQHLNSGTADGAIRPPTVTLPAHSHETSISGPSTPSHSAQPSPVSGGPGAPAPAGADPVLAGGPVATLPAPAPGTGIAYPAPGPIGAPTPGPTFTVPPVAGAPGVSTGEKPSTRGGGIGEPGIGAEEPGSPFLRRTGRALPPGGVIGESEPGLDATGRGAIGARRINPVGGVLGEGEGGIGARRLSPVGGVFGEGEADVASATGRGLTGTRRINPVGGVIGEGEGGTAVSGSRGTAAGRSVAGRTDGRSEVEPARVGGRRRRRADDEGHTWDPDNPWEVVDGVAAVIEPGEEPRWHDAGPGVIGIDR